MAKEPARNRKSGSVLFDVLICGFLIAVMVCVRVSFLEDTFRELGGDRGLLDAAMLRQGSVLPYAASSLDGLYAAFLRLIFWLFGNREAAVACAQAALQIIALTCFYLACRNVCGVLYASAALLAVMFMEQGLWLMGALTPGNLLLFLTGLYLLLFSAALRRSERRNSRFFFFLGFFWTGALCGLLAAADSFGLLAAALSILLIVCVKKVPAGFVLGGGAGLAGALFLRGLWYGQTPEQPFLEYGETQFLTGEVNPLWRYGAGSAASGVLVLLFVLGVLLSLLLQSRRRSRAGRADEALPLPVYRQRYRQMEAGGLFYDDAAVALPGRPVRSAAVSAPARETEKPAAVRYIENPLPGPRPHVKKEMDYAFEPDESLMCFDLNDFPDDEDFDIQ